MDGAHAPAVLIAHCRTSAVFLALALAGSGTNVGVVPGRTLPRTSAVTELPTGRHESVLYDLEARAQVRLWVRLRDRLQIDTVRDGIY